MEGLVGLVELGGLYGVRFFRKRQPIGCPTNPTNPTNYT